MQSNSAHGPTAVGPPTRGRRLPIPVVKLPRSNSPPYSCSRIPAVKSPWSNPRRRRHRSEGARRPPAAGRGGRRAQRRVGVWGPHSGHGPHRRNRTSLATWEGPSWGVAIGVSHMPGHLCPALGPLLRALGDLLRDLLQMQNSTILSISSAPIPPYHHLQLNLRRSRRFFL